MLSILSVIICAVLLIKLLFFTDQHRQQSRWYYRVLLYLVTLYDGNQVIEFAYMPSRAVGFGEVVFHLLMLAGAFLVKPEYLPWNRPAEPKPQLSKVSP